MFSQCQITPPIPRNNDHVDSDRFVRCRRMGSEHDHGTCPERQEPKGNRAGNKAQAEFLTISKFVRFLMLRIKDEILSWIYDIKCLIIAQQKENYLWD